MKMFKKLFPKLMGCTFLVSVGAMDSESIVLPLVLCMVSGAYLVIYARVHGWMQ